MPDEATLAERVVGGERDTAEKMLQEIIEQHRTGYDLDEVMRKNKDYQEAQEQQVAFDMLDEFGFTKEQKSMID